MKHIDLMWDIVNVYPKFGFLLYYCNSMVAYLICHVKFFIASNSPLIMPIDYWMVSVVYTYASVAGYHPSWNGVLACPEWHPSAAAGVGNCSVYHRLCSTQTKWNLGLTWKFRTLLQHNKIYRCFTSHYAYMPVHQYCHDTRF